MRTSFAEALFEPVLVKYLLYWIKSQVENHRSIKLSMSPMKNNLLLSNYQGIDCYKESAKLKLVPCGASDARSVDAPVYNQLNAKEISNYIIQCVDNIKDHRLSNGWRDLALLCDGRDHEPVLDFAHRADNNIIIKGRYKGRNSRKSLLFYVVVDCFQEVERDITVTYRSVYFNLGSTKKINSSSQLWRSDGVYAECISKDLLAETRLMDRQGMCRTPVVHDEALRNGSDAIKRKAYRTLLEGLILRRKNFRYLAPIPADQADASDDRSKISFSSKATHSKRLSDAFLDLDEFVRGDDDFRRRLVYEQDGNVIRAKFDAK